MMCRPIVQEERDAAFDLLDALTRSGGVELDNVDMHVVLAATQR